MSHSEDRHLDFVLKHYKEGAFDTQKAIERFKDANGIRPTRRRSSLFYAVSAAAAILLGAFLFYSHQSRQWTEIYADDIQKTVVLPDNSCVTLAPGSNMSYRMKDSREVRMEGKIYFEVARDESRPFEVNADGAFVKVLGTEFMVDAPHDKVMVYVTGGKVLFAKNRSAEGLILTGGMGATLETGSDIPEANAAPDVNSIAWKRGSFIFEDAPLKDVLDCLSRHYGVSFAASDLSRKLSGEFSTEDLDLIISLIESALDVNIVKRQNL
jgi:ferric-dicitrate binding protein FerR (iron transport regulator)